MNMNNKQLERWAPWVLLALVVALWQAVCSGFSIPEFIFPAPLAIAQAMAEFDTMNGLNPYVKQMVEFLQRRSIGKNGRYLESLKNKQVPV